MEARKRYRGSCHCGAVRFRFDSDEIVSGCRCNCSICMRKGSVMSSAYIPADAFELEGGDALRVYQFGDKSLEHSFCERCGISLFSRVASLPPDYPGPARVGDRRVNLGCVDGVDPFALAIELLDGRSF